MNLPNYLRKKRGLLQIRKDGGWDVWNPYHSKLSAYLVAGGKNWPFKKNSKILYLGSAEGNTISYLSEICKTNSITAVEISPVAMAELLVLAKKKDNIIPCLCDAHFPEKQSIAKGDFEIFKNTEKRLSEIFEKVESVNINKWAKGHSAYFME